MKEIKTVIITSHSQDIGSLTPLADPISCVPSILYKTCSVLNKRVILSPIFRNQYSCHGVRTCVMVLCGVRACCWLQSVWVE